MSRKAAVANFMAAIGSSGPAAVTAADMPTVDLPQGPVNHRVADPPTSTLPPVVFVHGLLVNGEMWTGVADALAERGIRSYAPDLPLGVHSVALKPDTDISPRGVARLVLSFLEALGLTDVTLVGNDTGGALCQFLIDTDTSRGGLPPSGCWRSLT